MSEHSTHRWIRVDPGELDVGGITTVVAADRAVAITRTASGYGALDNHCPHQGGPLGDGQIEHGYVICPWHGYEYDPLTGAPPDGYGDCATSYEVDEREDGLYIRVPVADRVASVMDQMVEVMTDWGLDTVFGMVGHSNLGLADALRRAEESGRLRYYGIRHEGAAAFAASAYGKLIGRPAACCRSGADPRPHRPGRHPGAGAGRVPGASALRSVCCGGSVEPNRALPRERLRVGSPRDEACDRRA